MTLRQLLATHFSAASKNFFYQENFDSRFFEETYITTRTKESRLYADEVVRQLPDFFGDVYQRREWQVRRSSMKKLLSYLHKNPEHKTIMELGCGNGWLSHHLAKLHGREVLGVDVNKTELEQAVRVFNTSDNLTFLLAEIFTAPLPPKTFDIIVLASSIQYFKDVKSIVEKLFTLLTDNGEIHIIDSPVYAASEVSSAKERSAKHFAKLSSCLGDFYHHHTWESLKAFNAVILFKPEKWLALLLPWKHAHPFPWIRITK